MRRSLLLRLDLHIEFLFEFSCLERRLEDAGALDVLGQHDGSLIRLHLQLLGQGLGNVFLGNGGVELAGLGDLATEDEFLARDLASHTRLQSHFALLLFRTALDLLGVAAAHGRGRNECAAVREETIQCKTVSHDQEVILLSDAGDVLKEENFHGLNEVHKAARFYGPDLALSRVKLNSHFMGSWLIALQIAKAGRTTSFYRV